MRKISVFSFWLVYFICKKLLKRVAEGAYGPEKVSGIHNSDAKPEKNINVEAT
jgi:hypothetical protein